MPRLLVINAGDVFSRLVVIGDKQYSASGKPTWLCRCECGNELQVIGYSLSSGSRRSCGCLATDAARASLRSNLDAHKRKTGHGPNYKHGQSRAGDNSPTYRSWLAMKDRCKTTTRHNAANYVAKGISVCDSWLQSYEAFLFDMGERPRGKTIDRIRGEEGYYPGNCRWATPLEQAANRAHRR
jgi:hypothetical protein